MFVLVIQNTIGFYNFRIQSVLQNSWLAHLYEKPLTIIDAVEEPFSVLFLGKSKFNSPFWCLRDMFISSILIYSVSWIGKKNTMRILLFALILFSLVANRSVIVACLIGAIAGTVKEQFSRVMVSEYIGTYGIIAPIVAYLSGNQLIMDVAFALFLLLVSRDSIIKLFFETKILQELGDISFGIYALHWSVINSVGLGIFLVLYKKVNASAVVFLSFLGILAVTIMLAILFRKTIEKLTSIICNKIH